MSSKGYPADILTQVTEILAACKQIDSETVSYTHLTLPTICSV